MTSITAILTCHGRRSSTLAALDAFLAQADADLHLDAVVVDDASPDGTAQAVAAKFRRARVVAADGTLFWARGMARAEAEARKERPDFLLWLNDDVILRNGTVRELVTLVEREGCRAIAVGSLRDPSSGEVSYSGLRRAGLHPLRFERVEPADEPIEADTFNGNVVLVPRKAYEAVDGIDRGYEHALADLDYGLRARELGFRVIVAPLQAGTCALNGPRAPWLDPRLPVRARWRLLVGRKGVPPRSAARYLRRHGGRFWPIFWAAPYAKFALLTGVQSLAFGRKMCPAMKRASVVVGDDSCGNGSRSDGADRASAFDRAPAVRHRVRVDERVVVDREVATCEDGSAAPAQNRV